MKNKGKISPVKYLLVLAGMILMVLSANAEVYYWLGQTDDWNETANWIVEGEHPNSTPDSNDHVIFSALSVSHTVKFSGEISVASLITTVNIPFIFTSTDGAELHVIGGFTLSDSHQIQGDIQIFLENESKYPAYFDYSKTLASHLEISERADVNNLRVTSNSKSANCPFFTIVPNPTSPTCNEFNDGIASVLPPVDGVGPYTYQWVSGPASPQWLNRGAGTYTVIVIDLGQGGAPCNLDVFVNEPGPLTVFSMNATAPLCADVCNGTASPLVIGGNGGYTYNWSSGESGFSASALCATFTLFIEDQQGCTYDTTYIYSSIPDTIQFNAVVSDVVCNGDTDGAIDLNMSGGTGGFIFSWTGPGSFVSSQEDISNLAPGTYNIDVEDGNGCLASETFTISENPELLASTGVMNNLCGGGNEGAINLTISGGIAPFNISWTGPGYTSSDEDISGLTSGIYDAQIIDAAGCQISVQVEITEPAPVDVIITQTDVLCNGGSSGTANAAASGGQGPYSYAWTGDDGFTSTNAVISGLSAGTYLLEVEDDNGCLFSSSVDIGEPDALTADFSDTPLTCDGGDDASIDLTVFGGTPPYTYVWTGPSLFSSTNEDISGLEAGIYFVEITDDNDCVLDAQYEILEVAGIDISGTTGSTTCTNGNDGSVTISITGGQEPFSFAWTGPGSFNSSNQNISGLNAGTYSVVVTDDNGCAANASFVVNAPTALTATFVLTHVICPGAATGAIVTTPSGGTAPYTFLWIGPGSPATTQNISNALAGDYTLMLTDASGCTAFIGTTINQPPPFSISRIITNVTCFGGSNGAINITTSGGTPGYTYQWTGPNGFSSTSEDISGVTAGAYSLTVTDINGCTTTRNYNVNQPAQIIITPTITHVICSGDATGAISITVSGPGASTYSWTGPNGYISSSQSITNLLAGSYQLLVTKTGGCTASGSYVVNENSAIVFSPTITAISCFGAGDGSINLSASGGQGPFDFSWTGPNGFTSDQNSIINLLAGNYTATVTDANGCDATEIFTITEPDELAVTITATDISCFGETDGAAVSNISGGTPPYIYSWTGPDSFSETSDNIQDLEAGLYSLEVTDAAGCTANADINIVEPAALSLDVVITQPECLIDNGELTVIPSGGTVASGYTYSWTNELGNVIGTTATIAGLAPGEYEITVTDDNGCMANVITELTRDAFNVSASLTNATCPYTADGVITVTPISGAPPFVFSWTGPSGFTGNTPSITGLAPGVYSATVTDDIGCIINLVYDITEPLPFVFNPAVLPEICVGSGDGSIALSLAGGTAPYFVAWTGPSGFTSNAPAINNLEPGEYVVDLLDANGCVADTSIVVEPGTPIEIDLSAENPNCFGEFSGAVMATATNAVDPLDWSWSGPNGFTSIQPNISGLQAGAYYVDLTDANGCSALDSITLVNPAEIVLSVTVQNATCLEANGSADVVVTGGTGDLTFSWLNSLGAEISTTAGIVNVSSGIYTVTVTDTAGCVAIETVAISDANGFVNGLITDVSCSGGSDGSVEITVVDGQEPFDFTWSNSSGFFSNDEHIFDLVADTYSVTVTDANGCIYTANFDVEEPADLEVSETVSTVSCAGSDGSISLVISGGTAAYEVSWTGPNGFSGTGNIISGLDEGTYAYEITDANDCILNSFVEVTFAPDIVVDATLTDAACGAENTGEIAIEVAGGTSPYAFDWIGPDGYVSSAQNITDLQGGDYTLVITDANGCEIIMDYQIAQPEPVAVELAIVQPDCTVDNGSITATITGGTIITDYFITWTDDEGNFISFVNEASDLGPGIYHLLVSDVNGCIVEETIVLSNPGIEVAEDIFDISCSGETDGSVILDVIEGVEPYTVSWTGPDGFVADELTITDLAAGLYKYIITGADGCQAYGEVEITEPVLLSVSEEISSTCAGESTGMIDLTISGGNEPYEVSWTGPDGFSSGNINIADLSTGQYDVLITDENGCTLPATFEVIENPALDVTTDVSDISCFEANDGMITATVTGGTEPYETMWTGPDGFESSELEITNLIPGTYSMLITDDLGCTFDAEIELTQPEELLVAEDIQAAGCESPASLGTVMLTVSGGEPGYLVSWTGPSGFTSDQMNISDLETGLYQYTVTDAGNCIYGGEIEIILVEPIIVDTDVQEISCAGEADGSIELTVSGGQGPYTYTWTGPDGFSSDASLIENLEAGLYDLLVADDAGCQSLLTIELISPEPLIANIESTTDASCNTSSDGTITLSVSGGTTPYTYSWSGPDGYSSDIVSPQNISPGLYTLELTDANGCIANAEVTIGFMLEIFAYAGPDLLWCQSEVADTIFGTGLNAVSYYWTDLAGDTLTSTAALAFTPEPGSYQFVLHANDGFCAALDTVELVVPVRPDVDAGPDVEVFAEETFILGGNPTSQQTVNYLWTPGAQGSFNPSVANPSGFLLETTWFTVTVTDEFGCQNLDSVLVTILPEIGLTSGFTPNGDGVNDTWVIDNMELFPNNVVSIFNRWGTAVYQTNRYNASNAWDGTYEGKPLPVGTYYYAIELNDARFPNPYTGPLTIYR